jgi:redox-sensitive bicupin YhaK (pirin superfamily)
MVGPFIFFDHVGPVELASGLSRAADILPHPHIGLSTVTYLFAGALEVEGRAVSDTKMIVFRSGDEAVVQATAPSVLMLLGGEFVGERFIEWNFVSSSRERIEQAKADWRAGRMKLPDLDNFEFVPLPRQPCSKTTTDC